ncbi:MAG: hypothetical protein E4G90_07900 [Gemmatimonadales bacterium]|nr:MAG: hypothetical protein E4G90_07900 [Gemmatimonadales bacterium]
MIRRLGLLGLTVLAACSGPPPGPVGGEVTLALQSPNIDDGAVLIRIVGPITEITPSGDYLVSSAPLGTTATKIVVVGNLASGPLIRVYVPDLNLLSTYTVFVEQAASRTDFVLYDPSGYSIIIVR